MSKNDTESGSLDILLLHRHKEFTEECVELLNSFWQRNRTARLATLEKSCDSLPCSFLLVRTIDNKTEVIGYSRISDAQGAENACFTESVVVRQDLRGHGYGRKIMDETEKYAASKGYKQMFLNTTDKVDFYQHIGYHLSHPIITLGANASKIPQSMIDSLMNSKTIQSSSSCCKPKSCCDKNKGSEAVPSPPNQGPSGDTPHETPPVEGPQTPGEALCPPRPPPPPPVNKAKNDGAFDTYANDMCCDPTKVTWLKKDL